MNDPFELIPGSLAATSLYVHVPFCQHRCGYCDFPLVVNRDHLADEYVRAVGWELRRFHLEKSLQTLFFGGGTPTRLTRGQTERLVGDIRKRVGVVDECEISFEANPNDLDQEKAQHLADLGVNRLSVGVQAFEDRKLQRLERTHSADVARRSLEMLVHGGWNVGVDLIFGVAGDRVSDWTSDLRQAVELGVSHISTYNLTIEKGTAFWSRRHHGQILEVDEDRAADLFEAAIDFLTDHGYCHYEVSNFCLPGRECRHNQSYWRGKSWLGLGPGAASFAGGVRWKNHSSPTTYLRRCLQNKTPVDSADSLSATEVARERLVFGLRQLAGVSVAEFQMETGHSLHELGGEPLRRWLAEGWLLEDSMCIRLSRRGLMISDSLWPELL